MSKILFLCILFKKVVKKSHHQSPSSNIQVVPPPSHSASHIHYPGTSTIHPYSSTIHIQVVPLPRHSVSHIHYPGTSAIHCQCSSTINVHPLSMFIHYSSMFVHYPFSGGTPAPTLSVTHPLPWNWACPSATYGHKCPCYVEVKYNSKMLAYNF